MPIDRNVRLAPLLRWSFLLALGVNMGSGDDAVRYAHHILPMADAATAPVLILGL